MSGQRPRPGGVRSHSEMEWMRARRARGAIVLLVIAVGVLLAAFFRLQVIGSRDYRLRSESNRLRALTIPAPRGAIYDRHGRVLAENVPGYSLSLLPGPADSARATLRRLAPWLSLAEAEIDELVTRFRQRPGTALLVRDDLDPAVVAAVEERRPRFRMVLIETHPRRRYPAGPAVAHLLGYAGEISEEELALPEFVAYEPGRVVGKKGIERAYEHELGGEPGVRFVEVNARGSMVSEFAPRPTMPARPGRDLTLAVDLELQLLADSLFPDTMRGGVVALDPRSGEVLLLYSHPTFDPNQFVGGISAEEWALLRDDPAQPLLNRAASALYPPGSTWKLVVAALGLGAGATTIDTHMPASCGGSYQYGTRAFRCWKPHGHGSLSLSGAIKESCNVFFYQLGLRLGLDRLLAGVGSLGFRQRTGIDIPGEIAGRFPPSRDWYDRRFGPRGWTESVTLNLSIGQGETEQSLLGMAQFYAVLARGDPPVVPHVRRSEALDRRRAAWRLGLAEERRAELVTALARVVNEPGGTAWSHRLADWTLAGKTGTAQNPHGEPHSLFVGFAPAEDPRIVVAAIVENGHPDNTTSLAVPLGSRIVRAWLESEGVPPSPPPAPPSPAARPVAQAGPGPDAAAGGVRP
ncbi:MAG: penicillin-binding protein 2 [Gemmatimonadota bacterium]|nr:penicillin-binding protein 2 [Gemmatimonadota bacterium]